ncbi:hypothetical protein HNQ77_002262 [Silvibacterium bohemicum]|uniref:HEPN AbiU2-like domain-containing protein n=1 Tax=Silvibacterium bohemicum TaxID=1577686 RepID=A0A841JT27_9BACT|nr:hypothetical protein [Silvibacterium bohemicum]MBB6144310.1 hypothetical protein [Silvibacterium bohemicum]
MPKLHQAPLKDRFEVPAQECDVHDKRNLESYRTLWRKWMSWYDHSPDEPHSIEQQLHTMLFNDLTYRSIVVARSAAAPEVKVSAQASTLAYLLDTGYATTQTLAVMKLLDDRRDVISVMRLLKDVQKHRSVITREIYVSSFGFPYDPQSWQTDGRGLSTAVGVFGLEAPELTHWIQSHYLHETFDRLSGKRPDERSRGDVIPNAVFKRLHDWLETDSIRKLETLRNNFLAHAANSASRGETKNQGVRFVELDEAQRAIIRVERAITDLILARRIAREVVPMPPLGMFSTLNLVYATKEAEIQMYDRWDELAEERNGWKSGVLDELVPRLTRADEDGSGPS